MTGATGQTGMPGTDGSKITGSIFCQGDVSDAALWPGTDYWVVTYSADLFADGTIMATGSVSGASSSANDTVIYAPTQTGANTAPVYFVYDVFDLADDGSWTLSLDRTALVVTAVYTDVDISGGYVYWTFNPALCVVNSY